MKFDVTMTSGLKVAIVSRRCAVPSMWVTLYGKLKNLPIMRTRIPEIVMLNLSSCARRPFTLKRKFRLLGKG